MARTNELSRKEIAEHLLRVRDAGDSFRAFVELLHPDWDIPNFQFELAETLDALEKRTLGVNNLLVTMPPRHAKSTYSTEMFPSYFMARNPYRFTMSCSYSAELALGFGRKVRAVVEDPLIHQVFPDFELSTSARAADVWQTKVGGEYVAVGLNGVTTGRAANLLIVDDPIKTREEAESMTKRNKVWDFYTASLENRMQPEANGLPPIQIVILTRWHPDDLAGRLMETEDWQEGRWKHINYPAIRKSVHPVPVSRRSLPEDDPDHVATLDEYRSLPSKKRYVSRLIDEALWHERFPLEVLYRKQRLSPRDFASLYQQEPYIQGGNIIKAHWWRRYTHESKPDSFSTIIIAADTAFKKTETADYSVAVVAGMDRYGDMYILDVHREKLDFPELKAFLIRLNNTWRGRGLRAMYIEDKASGQSIIQELKRRSGMAVIPHKVVNDKVARVNAILPLIEGGRVLLPADAPWLDIFVQECVTFPASMHDDQVDALAMALDVLSKTGITPDAFDEALAYMPAPITPTQVGYREDARGAAIHPYGQSLNHRLHPHSKAWGGWGLVGSGR